MHIKNYILTLLSVSVVNYTVFLIHIDSDVMLMTVIVPFSATSPPKKGLSCVDTTTSNATITNFLLFSCIPLTSVPELHLKTHHFQACWIIVMMMMPVVITDTPITNPSRGPSCPPSSRVFSAPEHFVSHLASWTLWMWVTLGMFPWIHADSPKTLAASLSSARLSSAQLSSL